MSSAMNHNDMPNYHDRPQSRNRRTGRRVFHRGVLVWGIVGLLLLAAAVPAAFYVVAHVGPGASTSSSLSASPSDRFIQSIVTHDGALGWHQLCPSVQAQLPMDVLKKQADAQRLAMAKQGVWLTAKPVGTHPQDDGGVSHEYVVTAHWRSGATQSLTFTVFTQSSGCVEDVQS
jgi:hypothetical protein